MCLLVKVVVVVHEGGGDSEWNGNLCIPINITVLLISFGWEISYGQCNPLPLSTLWGKQRPWFHPVNQHRER